MDNIHKIIDSVEEQKTLQDLEDLKQKVIGKEGVLTLETNKLKALSKPEEKAKLGQKINILKQEFIARLKKATSKINDEILQEKLKEERIDITLPARANSSFGKVHLISHTIDEIINILGSIGFVLEDGPEIETEWNNFTALNIPEYHSARQEHDTFYINDVDDNGNRKVLRTHTSNVQVRTMQKGKMPIKIIAPGKTYRSDHDSTHSPMFHQVEGLFVAENVSIVDLKGTLEYFCNKFFETEDLPLRFRPSYFPFTEPSFEVDIRCSFEKGGIKVSKDGDRWLEVLGCGMVHKNVLQNCGIDNTKYNGFAFGMGIERFSMLKYGISDLRVFYNSDIRWLKHNGIMPFFMPSLLRNMGNN